MVATETRGGERGTGPLKAPFPRETYAGGKSRIADRVWLRLGDVDNYVEPFCGSLATLLKRPAEHFRNGYRVETVNDANHYLVNFWRAVKAAPEAVAEFADWPVMEADLHARHKWLVRSEHAAGWRKKMAEDPEHYDAKMAGWWCWGACCWIGGMWCADGSVQHERRQSFSFNNLGPGVRSDRPGMAEGRPQLTDAFDIGRGVNSGGSVDWTQVPDLANSRNRGTEDQTQRPGIHQPGWGVGAALAIGTTAARRAWLINWFTALSDRLRLVRTCYGHWSRICDSDSTMTRLGTTGVFLDPPYPAKRADGTKSRDDSLYVNDKLQCLDALRDEVLAWCRKWSGPQVRIAVCGYEGDGYEALVAEGWTEESWEAGGGYANQRRGGKGKSENAKRERIWYSPACVPDVSLFSSVPA